MQNIEIRAYIIDKKNRNFWYLKYQVFIENESVTKKEESTKVLKTEKTLKFMKTHYLPAYISEKLLEYKKEQKHNASFEHYSRVFLKEHEHQDDYKNIAYKVNRILIDFSKLELEIISKLQIRLWINNLIDRRSNKELTKRSKMKYLGIFRGIFQVAVDDDLLERNIINDIRITGKKSDQNDIKPFFKDEVSLLLEKSKNPIYGNDLHDYLAIALRQGISPAEMIGLQIDDINIANRTISIKRNITKGVVKGTKNVYRKRVIPIFDSSIPHIHQLINKAVKKESVWLFSDSGGNHLYDIASLRGSRLIEKDKKRVKSNTKWYKLLCDSDIEYRDLKNCRHTFAVAAIESNNFTLQEIADILGHSSLKMLIEHYAKWIKGKGLYADTTVDLYN